MVTNKAYDWSALAPDPDAETLLIVTASGGGSRAAGLALGTLSALAMLLSSINSSIDRASFGTAERLRELMENEWKDYSNQVASMRRESETKKEWENAETYSQLEHQLRNLADQSAFLSVEFDAIPDAECRRKMQAIPTSWSLTGQQVDATIAMGRALLLANPDGAKLLALARSNSPPPAIAPVAEVCAGLPAQW